MRNQVSWAELGCAELSWAELSCREAGGAGNLSWGSWKSELGELEIWAGGAGNSELRELAWELV